MYSPSLRVLLGAQTKFVVAVLVAACPLFRGKHVAAPEAAMRPEVAAHGVASGFGMGFVNFPLTWFRLFPGQWLALQAPSSAKW